MIKSKSKIEPSNDEVRNKDEAIKKLKKDRLKIKQESEQFARKVSAYSIKSK
jgi:uncharacterized protein YdcH (DUF465 family)